MKSWSHRTAPWAVAVALLAGLGVAARAAAQEGDDHRVRFHGPPPFEAPFGGPGDLMIGMVGAHEAFEGRVVKNAPYQAEAVTEITQTLADGNRISRKTTSAVYRDSAGRMRRELTLAAVGPLLSGPESKGKTVFIHDPVAKESYVLETESRTARKMKAHFGQHRPEGEAEGVERAPHPRGPEHGRGVRKALPEPQREDLGKQTIDGVEAEGTRSTFTIPAGEIGNERPIEVVSERWYSPELQTVVMSIHRDPRMGETTYRLTNINRTEPDHALFEVPADYTVKQGPPEQRFFERKVPPPER